jgi:hypothetical protein
VDLDPADEERLRRLLAGARYSGAARRKLGELADERGWDEDELRRAIATLGPALGDDGDGQPTAPTAEVACAALSPTVVCQSNYPDGSTEITVGSVRGRFTTITSATGSVSHGYRGQPPHGEDDVLEACESLMEALKARGVSFAGKFRRAEGREIGVDACATLTNGDEQLEVQVVGVSEQAIWSELGRTGSAASMATPDQLADQVCAAVTAKAAVYPADDRAGRVLLVDATRSPGHTTPAVINALKQPERGAVLGASGFGAVWLAGPTPALTYLLSA